MRTSTLEPLTLLVPSPSSKQDSFGDEHCGCGCGCGVSFTQLALPQDTIERIGEAEHTWPAQP